MGHGFGELLQEVEALHGRRREERDAEHTSWAHAAGVGRHAGESAAEVLAHGDGGSGGAQAEVHVRATIEGFAEAVFLKGSGDPGERIGIFAGIRPILEGHELEEENLVEVGGVVGSRLREGDAGFGAGGAIREQAEQGEGEDRGGDEATAWATAPDWLK